MKKISQQALASDPRLAGEFAALKATREMVRGLPRMRVPGDFADRVLAQAERQHLTRVTASRMPALGWLGRLAIAASLLVVATSGIIVATSMWKNVPVLTPPVSVATIDAIERRDEKTDKGGLVKEGGGSFRPFRR